MIESKDKIDTFLKELNSWEPPEYLFTNQSYSIYSLDGIKPPYLVGIYHKEKIGTERSEGGGGYGGAYYSVYQRKFDAVYDITNAVSNKDYGESLQGLFYQVVRDRATTIPASRHTELI